MANEAARIATIGLGNAGPIALPALLHALGRQIDTDSTGTDGSILLRRLIGMAHAAKAIGNMGLLLSASDAAAATTSLQAALQSASSVTSISPAIVGAATAASSASVAALGLVAQQCHNLGENASYTAAVWTLRRMLGDLEPQSAPAKAEMLPVSSGSTNMTLIRTAAIALVRAASCGNEDGRQPKLLWDAEATKFANTCVDRCIPEQFRFGRDLRNGFVRALIVEGLQRVRAIESLS